MRSQPRFHGAHAARGAGLCQRHLADQKLPEREREGYTLLLALRGWEFRPLPKCGVEAAQTSMSSQNTLF